MKRFFVLIWVLIGVNQAVFATTEMVVTAKYRTSRGQSLEEIVNFAFEIPIKFLKTRKGQELLEKIKVLNPQITNWKSTPRGRIITLEMPKEVRPYYSVPQYLRNVTVREKGKKSKNLEYRNLEAPPEITYTPPKRKRFLVVIKEETRPIQARKPMSEKIEIVQDTRQHKHFVDTYISAQTGTYSDDTSNGESIDTEKGLLGVGIHPIITWDEKKEWLVYGDLIYDHSGSVTVGNTNSAYSNPNAWTFGGGLHYPRYWKELDVELGLERKEVSYLSYDKNQTINTSNAASLLYGFKATFYSVKAKAIFPFYFGTKKANLSLAAYQSLIGSGELDLGGYTPSMSLFGYKAGYRQYVWKTYYFEVNYENNTMSADNDTSSVETVVAINIGSMVGL